MGNNNNDKNGKKKKFRRGACTPHYKWCADGWGAPLSGGPPILGVVSHHAQTVGTNENAPI